MLKLNYTYVPYLHPVALGRVNIAEMITSFTCISLSLPLPLIHTSYRFTPTARDDTSSEAILAGVI